jgi:hypothetical protein
LREQPIIGRPLRLIVPIRGHILTGIAKGVRAFDPDFFALEGPLELLQHAQFVVAPVHPHRPVWVRFEHGVPPAGQHDSCDRDLLGEVLVFRPQIPLDYGQRLDDWLKAVLTAKHQVLQDRGEDLPIVVDVLLPHDVLIPDAILRPTPFGLGDLLPKGGFGDPGKEGLTDGPIGFLHDRLSHSEQQLHLPCHPLDIPQQLLMEVFFSLRRNAPDDLQQPADNVVGHFHGAGTNRAGYQGVADRVRMRPHLAGMLMLGPLLQDLEEFQGHVGAGIYRHPEGPELLEFRDFLVQWLHAGGGRLRFELVKRRL